MILSDSGQWVTLLRFEWEWGFLLTVVDKAVKLVIIRKLPNKRAETVVAAFRDIVANTFCEFKTLTADNGSEFSQHGEITKVTGAPVYFARPYSQATLF